MIPDFRKLLGDGKQWMDCMELTFERLPEIFFRNSDKESRRRRLPGRYPGRI